MTERAVLFPGQGAQFVGMSADLLERSPRAKSMFEAASQLMGEDLWSICAEGPEEKLNSTAVSQPAIFVVSLAVLDGIEAAGGGDQLEAMGTAGLSLGEYSALVFAGSIDFDVAVEIVVQRGRYMQEACDAHPSGMTSFIGFDLDMIRAVVEQASAVGTIAVANVNAHNQVVVSGELSALEKAAEIAQEKAAGRIVPLKVAGAYHSPLMASASGKLRPLLERAQIRPPRVPFYPNTRAEVTSEPDEIRAGLLRQIESTVLWVQTLEGLVAAGMTSVIQPGPGKVVRGLVRQVDRGIPVESVLSGESIDALIGKASSS